MIENELEKELNRMTVRKEMVEWGCLVCIKSEMKMLRYSEISLELLIRNGLKAV